VLYQALANPAENDFAMFIKINVAQGVDAVSKGSIMRASLLKTSGFRTIFGAARWAPERPVFAGRSPANRSLTID
jgi:hypothetical protein